MPIFCFVLHFTFSHTKPAYWPFCKRLLRQAKSAWQEAIEDATTQLATLRSELATSQGIASSLNAKLADNEIVIVSLRAKLENHAAKTQQVKTLGLTFSN